MKGEELRSRRDPSVSELLARRVAGDRPRPPAADDPRRRAGTRLRVGAPAPPLGSESLAARDPDADDPGPRVRRPGSLRRLCQILTLMEYLRVRPDPRRAGEPAALAEYAAEIRKWDPEKDQPQGLAAFEPMWTYPDDPAIREAARWLFNDPGSPWAAFVRNPGSPGCHSSSTRASTLRLSCAWPGFARPCSPRWRSGRSWGRPGAASGPGVQYELKDGVGGDSASPRPTWRESSREWTVVPRLRLHRLADLGRSRVRPGASCTGRRRCGTRPSSRVWRS